MNAPHGPGLLTTGQAAGLCGVTPDAVLKWIKKGRLAAARTMGGHYRVARRALEALGLARGPAGGEGEDGRAEAGPAPAPVYCWEYFSRHGVPSESCNGCLVYRAKVEKCYEVASLGPSVGHQRRHCRTTCQDCSFFRIRQGLPVAVLVFTKDAGLARRLSGKTDGKGFTVRLARCGYEGAAQIETLRPDLVVIDGALPEARDGRLARSILEDARIPGAKVWLALRKGEKAAAGDPRMAALPAPLTLERIEGLVKALARAPVPCAGRPAARG